MPQEPVTLESLQAQLGSIPEETRRRFVAVDALKAERDRGLSDLKRSVASAVIADPLNPNAFASAYHEVTSPKALRIIGLHVMIEAMEADPDFADAIEEVGPIVQEIRALHS